MTKLFAILVIVLGTNTVFAQESGSNTTSETTPAKSEAPKKPLAESAKDLLNTTGEALQDASGRVAQKLDETKIRRASKDYFVLGTYSPVDLLIPSKKGLTVGLIKDASETWEFEYLSGSVSLPWIVKDLGEMTDRRFSLIRRTYSKRNSFNFSYGLTYTDFSIHLGNDIMSRVSGGRSPSLDLVEIETLGANFAIGNRWSFDKNITLSVDWFSWAQPLKVIRKKHDFLSKATNDSDRDDVGKAASVIAYFPRFAVFKIQLGILF
ncbi:MAG: hypothetical protein KF789_10985 [Bdellovibrionaceae bacterium]|nr:hypothetical protein [Pseudobdellovibrionaceae bacterium]